MKMIQTNDLQNVMDVIQSTKIRTAIFIMENESGESMVYTTGRSSRLYAVFNAAADVNAELDSVRMMSAVAYMLDVTSRGGQDE